MRKLLLSLCILCVQARFAACAELVLPTAIGTSWEYQISDSAEKSAQPSRMLVRIGGIDDVDGQQLLRFETIDGDAVKQREFISVDGRGALTHWRVFADGTTKTFQSPQTIVPAALAVGAKWDFDDATANGEVHRQFVVAAEEKIDVPAGSFRAFRIQCDQPWPVATTLERWFVPGVGLVKEVATTHGPSGRLLNRTTTALTKFTPGTMPIAEPTVALPPSAEISAASTPAPTPPPPTVKLELASSRESAAVTEFRSDAANIFVRWSGENLPVDATVRLAWIAEDVGDVVDPNFIIDEVKRTVSSPQFSGRFTLSRPPDGWAPGKYRIELYLDDKLMETVKCTIGD